MVTTYDPRLTVRVDPSTGRVTQVNAGGTATMGMIGGVGGGQIYGAGNLGPGMFVGPNGAQQYKDWLATQGYQASGSGAAGDPLQIRTQSGQLTAIPNLRLGGGFDAGKISQQSNKTRASASASTGGQPAGGAPGGGRGIGGPMFELAKRELARQYGENAKQLEEQFAARGMARSGPYFAALQKLQRDQADALTDAQLRAEIAEQNRIERAMELDRQAQAMDRQDQDRSLSMSLSAAGTSGAIASGRSVSSPGAGGARNTFGGGGGEGGGGFSVPMLGIGAGSNAGQGNATLMKDYVRDMAQGVVTGGDPSQAPTSLANWLSRRR